MADLTDLNPAFVPRLNAFLAALDKLGVKYNVISGYRNSELQSKLYANYQAALHHQPLPYPEEGSGGVAAPPGRSYHNFGMAADVVPTNPADYQRMWSIAPQYGLTALGAYDKPHFQMAGWRPSGEPATGIAARGASQSPWDGPSTAERAAFIKDYANQIGLDPNLALGIANAEGLNAWGPKNPNAGSYVDRLSGQPFSFGDFQLNTNRGLGVDALAQGIDPRDPSQWKLADAYAMNRMQAGGVGPWSGDPYAKAYMSTGVAPGTTINTAPSTASAYASQQSQPQTSTAQNILTALQTGRLPPGSKAEAIAEKFGYQPTSTAPGPDIGQGVGGGIGSVVPDASSSVASSGGPSFGSVMSGIGDLAGALGGGKGSGGQAGGGGDSGLQPAPTPQLQMAQPAGLRNTSPLLGGVPGQPSPWIAAQMLQQSAPMGGGPATPAQSPDQAAALAMARLNAIQQQLGQFPDMPVQAQMVPTYPMGGYYG